MSYKMQAIIDAATKDGCGWRNRNPEAPEPVPRVVQNHWCLSRAQGKLGAVSRTPRGFAWQEYDRAFRAAAGVAKRAD